MAREMTCLIYSMCACRETEEREAGEREAAGESESPNNNNNNSLILLTIREESLFEVYYVITCPGWVGRGAGQVL